MVLPTPYGITLCPHLVPHLLIWSLLLSQWSYLRYLRLTLTFGHHLIYPPPLLYQVSCVNYLSLILVVLPPVMSGFSHFIQLDLSIFPVPHFSNQRVHSSCWVFIFHTALFLVYFIICSFS